MITAIFDHIKEIAGANPNHYFIKAMILWGMCCYVFLALATLLVNFFMRIINRIIRSRNIKHHGWPEAPLDADGDIVYPKKKKEEES